MIASGRTKVRHWASIALALVAMTGLATPRAQAAGLLVADGGFGGVLEIKEHAATVTINNGIAVTEIEQTFVNTENRTVEALYILPVPKGASVANFSMWINGTEMIGEVVEKERAREIYNSYKQQARPRDPGLLEQVDYKTFEMRIFPILANAEQRIRLSYYQELDVDHNWASYTYPLATVARKDLDQRTTGRFAMSLRVKSEVPIEQMSSPSHGEAFVFTRHNEFFQEATLELTGGDLSRDLVVDYKLARPVTGLDVITSRPDGEDGYFLLTLTAGEELAKLDQGMDYVFVLDVSGSMAIDGKLGLSTQSIAAFIEALSPEDRVEVLTFNMQPTTLFRELRKADDAAKAEARAFLDSQRARGGTVLSPAITLAYQYGNADRPMNVVVFSDGMTEQSERTELLNLIRQRPAHARVFTIGVGNEVDRPLLQQVAKDAGGLAAFVSRGADFERQAQAFRRKLQHPVATNLQIEVAGLETYDVEPRVLPNLYHGAPVRVYGRYKSGGEAKVTLRGDVLGKQVQKTVALTLPKGDGGNPEIERMWAFHRIQNLLAEADRSGSRSNVVDEIVRLGEGYSIMSEYTSFIVLENDGEYRRWRIERRNESRIARDRGRREALNQQLVQLRQQSAQALGPVDGDGQPKVVTADPAQRQASGDPATARPESRGADIDFGLPGGGALDPYTAALAIALTGLILLPGRARRRLLRC